MDSMPCSFRSYGRCSGDVVQHHVRIKGLCGTGMKPPDWSTIPVCNAHHTGSYSCHHGDISQKEQEDALVLYWIEVLTQQHGRAKAFEMMGIAFDGWRSD